MSQQERTQKGQALLDSLTQFNGDLERYRHWLCRRLIYTPGVQCMAEEAGAYWLIDAIASWLGTAEYRRAVCEDSRIGDLHFWRLEVRQDSSAVLFARADSGEEPFISQDIPYTDFPLDEFDLWVADDGEHWTLYLPREH